MERTLQIHWYCEALSKNDLVCYVAKVLIWRHTRTCTLEDDSIASYLHGTTAGIGEFNEFRKGGRRIPRLPMLRHCHSEEMCLPVVPTIVVQIPANASLIGQR